MWSVTIGLFIVAALGLLLSTAAGFVFLAFCALPAAIATALVMLLETRKREGQRLGAAAEAGISLDAMRGPLLDALAAVGSLVPLALFVLLRLPVGCTVLNIFGLPWPTPVEIVALILSGIVAIVGLATATVAIWLPRFRSLSAPLWIEWLIVTPPAWIIFFLSVYGDPGPTTCM